MANTIHTGQGGEDFTKLEDPPLTLEEAGTAALARTAAFAEVTGTLTARAAATVAVAIERIMRMYKVSKIPDRP
jgi:hypothetical protein